VINCKANKRLLKRVAEVYTWIECQVTEHAKLVGLCDACGKCCDFDAFDHRLFVTPPEVMFLTANLGSEGIKPMITSLCPYNIKGKCSVYEYRFAGCRIFYCKGDKNFQSQLSESALKKFKSICDDFQIPYHYIDIATAFNSFAGT
jgi:Fe-S-cluster containining protein